MADYKLIALDMDGTLLNSEKAISERNRAAIAVARKKGVYVVLASGRPYEGMQKYLQQLGMTGEDDYVLCYNGAVVERIADGQILNKKLSISGISHGYFLP